MEDIQVGEASSPQKRRSPNTRHDVANELAVIIGFSDLLLQEVEADHARRADLEAIRNAAQRAIELLAGMKTSCEM